MEVTKVNKKLRLSKYDAVKYQLMTELLLFRKEHIIESDLELLTLLGLWGPYELRKFCNAAAKKLYTFNEPEEFAVKAQNVRNKLIKLEKKGFIVKSSGDKKYVKIADNLNVIVSGNILISHNFLALESN